MKSILLLASRYAQAFLRIYDAQIVIHDINQLQDIVDIVESQRLGLFLADLHMIELSNQVAWFKQLIGQSPLAKPLYSLVNLLISHKRISLFPAVIKDLIKSYLKNHNIYKITVKSFPSLLHEDKNTIELFLKQRYGSAVLIRYEIDARLLAGISIQTDDELWQYSCAQQLNDMRTASMR